MTALPWGRPLTVDDLDDVPDDGHRYELLDGTLLVSPAPIPRHQTCVLELAVALRSAVGADHMVLIAPCDWVVSEHTLFQPDLLVTRRADVGEKRLERTPLLVVEILSPSTRRVDLATKRVAYADAGVAHYWVVDPEVPSVTAMRLPDGDYSDITTASGDEPLHVAEPFPLTVVPSALLTGPTPHDDQQP